MAEYRSGDVVGDCPGCDNSNAVIYRGGNEAICKSCGSIYEVSFEDDEHGDQSEAASDPAPVEPAATPAPAARPTQQAAEILRDQQPHMPDPVIPRLDEPTSFATPNVGQPEIGTLKDTFPREPVRVAINDVGKLTDVAFSPIKAVKNTLRLDPDLEDRAVTELGIPAYILKSRPWKWAHQMGRLGNPYRSTSKNAIVYVTLQECPMTVAELVMAMDAKMGDKVSFLLVVYEVVTQCVAAGLLVMDPQTRKISVCQGQPQAAKLP